MSAKSQKFEVEFEFLKETPGAVRYSEIETDEAPKIVSLYVRKFAIKQMGSPKRIKVTIEALP